MSIDYSNMRSTILAITLSYAIFGLNSATYAATAPHASLKNTAKHGAHSTIKAHAVPQKPAGRELIEPESAKGPLTEPSLLEPATPAADKNASQGPIDGGTPKVITSPAVKKQADKSAETVHSQNPEVQQQIKTELAEPKLEEKSKLDPSSPTGVTTTLTERRTVALALGGGGARGAAHVGVLRVLEREHIPIDLIVGNSMGSIVGGLYASGVSLDKISTALEDKSLRKAYMPGMIPPKLLIAPFSKMIHPFKKHYAGLFDGQKFEQYLGNMMPTPNETFEQTKIRFSAVATNLIDGKAYSISKGKVATAIRASASIAPLLQPVPIEDKLYVDGGVRANLPAFAARESGANIVVAVLVDEPLQIQPPQTFFKYKAITMRQADVVLAINDEHQLQYADIVINPDVSGIPILSDNPEDARRAIIAGEKAAEKALPELRKRLAQPAPSKSGIAGQSGVQ